MVLSRRKCYNFRLFTITVFIIWIVLSVFLLAACNDDNTRILKIGLISPFSGDLAEIGIGTREGAQLALLSNLDDGRLQVNGKKYRIEFIEKDCETNPELAVRSAHELINQEQVVAIIGPPLSDLAIPVAGICDSSGVPMITQIATNPKVTDGRRCVYRVCYTDSFQGVSIARFSSDSLGATTAGVLYDEANLYCQTVTNIFIRQFTQLGGTITAHTKYTTDNREISNQLETIAAAEPDVLFLPNYLDDLREHLPQIQAAGIQSTIVGCDTMDFRHKIDRLLLNGAYFSGHYTNDVPTQRVQEFVSKYAERFDRKPTAVGALTYDAFGFLFHALKTAENITPEAICMAIRSINIYNGVTGIMKFNGSPDPEKSITIIHVESGEFAFHAQVDP